MVIYLDSCNSNRFKIKGDKMKRLFLVLASIIVFNCDNGVITHEINHECQTPGEVSCNASNEKI